ncbi:MAG: O-antigen ligase domain-containing protein [Alphaproteobacteria bacterium]|nr:MAG: O-antigen ligase domain-containing protein [Alphaproteobacteria bacterium]
MLQEDKQILWRASAVLLGMALPSILLGKSIVYGLLVLGIFSGLMATKDESLRATVKLLWNSRITVMVMLLMASLLVGVVIGIDPSFALERWSQVAGILVGGAALFVAMREMPGRHLELMLKVLAISTVTVAGLALLDALLGDPRLSAAMHGEEMALTPYRLNFMSSVLAVLLPFVWARLLVKSREGEPFAVRIALPVASFLFVVAIVCGGRSGWGGLLVGALIFIVFAGRYHGFVIHKHHWLMGVCLAAGALALYAFSFGNEFAVDRMTIIGEADEGRGLLSGRLEVWGQVLANVWREPFFGIGVMNYRNLPDAIDLHPHNWFLQILLEGGIVSLVLFVSLLGTMLWRFAQYAKGSIYGIAAFASVSAFLVSGLAYTSIFNGWWVCFLIVSAIFGWRAGWNGVDLKKRRRTTVVVKG